MGKFSIKFLVFGLFLISKVIGDDPIEMMDNYYEIMKSEEEPIDTCDDPLLFKYLQVAAMNNQELEAAFNQWKAALEVILEVDVLPDPNFTFAYFIHSVETRTGPQRAKFSLTQTFPWMGKLKLRGGRALEEANVYKAKFHAIRLRIFYDVKKVYYELSYLAKAIQITKENIALLRYVEAVARNSLSAGNAPYADVIRTQVELGKLEDQEKTLEDLKRPLLAKLNAAMNLPMSHTLVAPYPTQLIHIKASDEDLTLYLKNKNPNLQMFDYIAASEQVGIKLAYKEFFPDFTFGIETIPTGSAVTRKTPDSGKWPIIASVSLNIPIWVEKRRAGVRKATRRRNAAMEDRTGLEENLLADLQYALYKYRDAERKVDLYGDTLVPKAIEALKVVLEAFETEKKNYLDLIDSERTLLEFELAYELALSEQAKSVAELELLTGVEIPCNVLERPNYSCPVPSSDSTKMQENKIFREEKKSTEN